MKNIRWLCALGLVLSLNAVNAEEPKPPAPPPPPQAPEPLQFEIGVPAPDGGERDIFVPRMQGFGMQTVKATYVGVGVNEADATLRNQLKLPDGIGLAVNHVDADGPASKAGVKQHDVLIKLKDQHLVNLQQFVTLVRMNKPGESIELTLLREGTPQTLTVTAGEKDLPPLESYAGGRMGMPGTMRWNMATPNIQPFAPGMGAGGIQVFNDPNGAAQVGEVLLQDDDHNIRFTTKDNKPNLVVKGKDGKVVFEGDPKQAPENIQALVKKYKLLDMARPNVMFFNHRIIEGPQPAKPIPAPGRQENEKF
jgi:hypothetical protein